MKHWKSMIIAAALALPLSVIAAETVADEDLVASTAVVEVDGKAPEAYSCCWIWMNGHWWCVYC